MGCLYWQSFYQIYHSTLWWTVVSVIWLTLCQECCREMFRANYCSPKTPQSFFSCLRISLSAMRMTHFDSCCVIPRVAVAESLNRDLGTVSEWCDHWLMKLNARKTKTMRVSRLSTMHPQSPPFNHYCWYCAEEVWWPRKSWVRFDSNLRWL